MNTRTLTLLLVALALIACNETFTIGMEHTPGETVTQLSTVTSLPATATSLPATATSAATFTPLPTMAATAVLPIPADNYIDDRSTPSQVIVSYYNALNRGEYLRAYNYWINPSGTQGSFSKFVSGYNDTSRVDLVFGSITSGVSAGLIYYTVPVLLKATAINGVQANWAACYVIHQARPENFSLPPFSPMGIIWGSAQAYGPLVDDASALSTACSVYPNNGPAVAISRNPLNVDKTNFLDDRSGPLETVTSLLNALNRKEYVRAYGYYQNPTIYPGTFDQYAAGYADIATIIAVFGTSQSEVAASKLYYKQPLAMRVQKIDASIQTFVGCYALQLAQPTAQYTPPFQPMSITAGNFNVVGNNVDVSTLLPAACR
ncbi:MAG: hypothetical protein WAN58_07540 [Anaerolineales bacterium]